jgi:hypothetical protein
LVLRGIIGKGKIENRGFKINRWYPGHDYISSPVSFILKTVSKVQSRAAAMAAKLPVLRVVSGTWGWTGKTNFWVRIVLAV